MHRRRSRHSFEPEDLSDADLDRLLRGWSSGVRAGAAGGRAGGATGGLPAAALSWSAWTKLALAVGVLLVVVGVVSIVGVITAAGDTRDVITRDSTRQTREPATTAPPPEPGDAPVPADRPGPPPTSSPPSTAPPTTTAPPPATDPAPDPAPSSGRSSAAPLPESAADVAAAVVSCHPSYDPCVPIADDVDCAGGEGDGPAYLDRTVDVTGPDVYGLDADHDDQACE